MGTTIKLEIRFQIVYVMLLLIQLGLNAQDDKLVFKYLEENVKTVHLSKSERIEYSYQKGVIIEKEFLLTDWSIRRHYYYQNIGIIDSIVYYSTYNDTTFVDNITYLYDYDRELVTRIQRGENLAEWINVDSITYRSDGQTDEVYQFSNRRESIFGTVKADSLLLQRIMKYEYDGNSQLIAAFSKTDTNNQTLKIKYDVEGLKLSEIKFLGFTARGCIRGNEKRYRHTTYRYNELGLPIMELNKYSIVNSRGQTRKDGRICFKWKYEYY